MTIKVTYNITDVYMSQSVSPVYITVSYSDGGASGGGVWGSITGTLSNQTDLQTALDAKLDESTIDGGTEGQILSKASAIDFDFAWINNYAKYLATNVRNQTGSTIGAFQVVYISGATGNKPLISLADADTEATSSKTYGVTATSIANNSTGDVVTAGELSGINTSAFNEGDLLWLSTTAGGVVTSPPAEPAHAVFIGYVVRSHPTLGVIDVAIANGYELNELHGVQITTPTDNQGLFYNATSTLWENKSITTALGYTPVPTTRNITINGVTYDLSADRTWTISTGISGSGAAGQVTYWTGASAVSGSNNLFWDATNNRLGIGTTTPSQVLHINNGAIQLTDSFPIRWGTSNLLYGSTTGLDITNTSFAVRFRFTVGGNFLINGIADSGQRLQVYGDTLLRGSGATASTDALRVQNSAGSAALSVNNGLAVTCHGDLYLGNTVLLWLSGSQIRNTSNGVLRICDSTGADFTRLQFGGTTTAFPALQRSGASICVMDATGAAGANLGVGTTSVNASAILQADSTTKGFLPPRMTTTQKNAIATPAAGLVVYDTTLNKLCVYTTAWETITSI